MVTPEALPASSARHFERGRTTMRLPPANHCAAKPSVTTATTMATQYGFIRLMNHQPTPMPTTIGGTSQARSCRDQVDGFQ